jgi:hypothetical protein
MSLFTERWTLGTGPHSAKTRFPSVKHSTKVALGKGLSAAVPKLTAVSLCRELRVGTRQSLGMKSHDFHIWIERILPAMVRGYVPKHVWLALSELSYFFRQLCAKELSRTVVADLERLALVLLCKLEKIFPPSFFNPMQYLILHLPYEA